MMEEAIHNFSQQFSYQPEIINKNKLRPGNKFVLLGMGGSHLAADIWHDVRLDSAKELFIHSDYGLPQLVNPRDYLYIASSYSGNTEEVIDGYKQAQRAGLSVAVITVGGTLLSLAKSDGLPYIQLPDTGIQPRSALGYSFRALLQLMNEGELLTQSAALVQKLDGAAAEKQGKALAEELSGYVPVIYASRRNAGVVYNWKIKMNETGKVPAFYNVIPELNHNEMTGFDVYPSSQYLSDRFYFLFLLDEEDDPRNRKRMEVLFQLYRERSLPVRTVTMSGQGRLFRVFTSLLMADWTACYLAKQYGLEAEQVPMVEDFKKRISV